MYKGKYFETDSDLSATFGRHPVFTSILFLLEVVFDTSFFFKLGDKLLLEIKSLWMLLCIENSLVGRVPMGTENVKWSIPVCAF